MKICEQHKQAWIRFHRAYDNFFYKHKRDKFDLVPSSTQENAFDVHSVGRFPQHCRRQSGMGGRIDPVKNMSFYHYLTFFSFVAIC